jgi:hypothetical protein
VEDSNTVHALSMMIEGFKHCSYKKNNERRIQTAHALSMMSGGFKQFMLYDD